MLPIRYLIIIVTVRIIHAGVVTKSVSKPQMTEELMLKMLIRVGVETVKS